MTNDKIGLLDDKQRQNEKKKQGNYAITLINDRIE